jgi:AbrB family looped-hinge helix DNA binding protein
MNMRTRVSSKGQVVIPKGVRDRLRFKVGTALDIIETADSVTFRRASPVEKLDFEEGLARVRAAVRYSGPRYSVEEEREAIDEMFRAAKRF